MPNPSMILYFSSITLKSVCLSTAVPVVRQFTVCVFLYPSLIYMRLTLRKWIVTLINLDICNLTYFAFRKPGFSPAGTETSSSHISDLAAFRSRVHLLLSAH